MFLILSIPQMFEFSSVIIMVLATTRMHRSLVNFARSPGSSEVYDALFASFHFPTQCGRFHFRTHERLRWSAFSKTKQTDSSPIAMNRIEVVVGKTIEQHPARSKSDDNSSIIISTSEQIPEIVVDLSKLTPPRAATNYLHISYSASARRPALLGGDYSLIY